MSRLGKLGWLVAALLVAKDVLRVRDERAAAAELAADPAAQHAVM